MNHDSKVDAQDAALVLIRAADYGASADGSMSEVDALYGDVNEDNNVNASDAANILGYSALVGAGQEVSPLGYSLYDADENGTLQKGGVEDPLVVVNNVLIDGTTCRGEVTIPAM